MVPQGYLERATRHHLCGWARDGAHPDVPARVVILCNDAVLTRVTANRHREDLEAALGSGRHGFDAYLPPTLLPSNRYVVRALIEGSGAELAQSPVIIEPATGLDPEMRRSIAAIVATAGTDQHAELLEFFAGQIERLLQERADLESHQVLRHFRNRWAKHRGPAIVQRAPEPPRRALVIGDALPEDWRDAPFAELLAVMLSLGRLGHEVTFLPANLDGRPEAETLLENVGIRCHRRPYTVSVEEVLRRQPGSFDVVVTHRLANAVRYGALLREHCDRARHIYLRSALPETYLVGRTVPGAGPAFVQLCAMRQAAERDAAARATDVVTPSVADAEALLAHAPSTRFHVLPPASSSEEAGAARDRFDAMMREVLRAPRRLR